MSRAHSKRKPWVWLFGTTLAVLALSSCRPSGEPLSATSADPLSNVVLVTLDTLRADRVGAYGYGRGATPFLDELAARGVLFENAFSASSHTAPSHASMFTGLYPEAHGLLRNGTALPESSATLASVLQDRGYQTAAFTSVAFLELLGDGFDHFDAGRRRAGATVTAARDWLASARDSGQPLFLWVHLYDVHQYGIRDARRTGFREKMRRAAEPSETLDDALYETNLRYDALLAYVDAQLSQLFEFVEAQEQGRETQWILTSDHGEGLGDHGYGGHGRHLYDEQLRVPLILYPGRPAPAGTRIPALVRTVDLFATAIDLAGLEEAEVPAGAGGVSLGPLLEDPEGRLPVDYAYAQRRPVDKKDIRRGWQEGTVIAAQSLHEKYIFREAGPDEYFDLTRDPDELENLVHERPAEAAAVRRWLVDMHADMRRAQRHEAQEVRPELVAELRALGYVE